MMKFYFFAIFLILPTISLYALTPEDVLTIRVLNVSKSRKTILINRGIEDGIMEGDHGKFYRTTGVFARGIAVNVSPSRSIWSLYRVVDKAEMGVDAVMNLKSDVVPKITDDPTRSLTPDDYPESEILDANTESIDSDTKPNKKNSGTSDQEELEALMDSNDNAVYSYVSTKKIINKKKASNYFQKTLNAWGGYVYSSGDLNTDNNGTNKTATGTVSGSGIGFGIEKYFSDQNSFLRSFSFGVVGYKSLTHDIQLETGPFLLQSGEVLEGGVLLNWHFLNDPMEQDKVIGFFETQAGMGNTKNVRGVDSFAGRSTYYLIGVGGKYFFASGLGIKGSLEYYSREEEYMVTGVGQSNYSNSMTGTRLGIAMSLRF